MEYFNKEIYLFIMIITIIIIMIIIIIKSIYLDNKVERKKKITIIKNL